MKRCIQEYDRKLNMHYARFKFEPRIMTYYKEKKGLNISSKISWGGGGWLIDSGFFFITGQKGILTSPKGVLIERIWYH